MDLFISSIRPLPTQLFNSYKKKKTCDRNGVRSRFMCIHVSRWNISKNHHNENDTRWNVKKLETPKTRNNVTFSMIWLLWQIITLISPCAFVLRVSYFSLSPLTNWWLCTMRYFPSGKDVSTIDYANIGLPKIYKIRIKKTKNRSLCRAPRRAQFVSISTRFLFLKFFFQFITDEKRWWKKNKK